MKLRSQKGKKILQEKVLKLLSKNSLSHKELVKKLALPEKELPHFQPFLDTLIEKNLIKKVRGKFSLKDPASPFSIGKISMHVRGFGFVSVEEREKDIFIPKPFTMDAVDGDEVEVEIFGDSPKGPEGKIVKILKRARSELAGIVLYRKNGKYSIYAPVLGPDKKVNLLSSKKVLKSGDRIIIKVKNWGREIDGTLHSYLGHISDPSLDIPAAIAEYEILHEFTKGSQQEAKKLGTEVKKKDLKDREDFTETEAITIDPDTAKDFDDALSVTKDPDGNYILAVHIADVAHYVKANGSLDKEAFLRANSTYFPGRCVPMLPETLSNGLCSLKPKVLRLTVTVLMTFDPSGDLLQRRIFRSFIKSKKRFTYGEAFAILEGKKKSPYKKHLEEMRNLCLLLKKKRMERGSIDFALPEAKILVDKKGTPMRIEVEEYDITHQMVEEFMLKANEMVAKTLTDRGNALIYRVHEEPNPESFEDFFGLARILGFQLPQNPKNTDIQKLFQKAKNSPHLYRLSVGFIRSMKLASYSPENLGHYGLQLEHYTHFTSPIRRYSDLVIQRLLFDEEKKRNLTKIATTLSEKERNSMKAENGVIHLKKMRLLNRAFRKDPYASYAATITRVKPFALFFELKDFFLEGSIHISEIGEDYYVFHPEKSVLRGDRSGESFAFGDEISVMITDIDLVMREAKFEMATRKPLPKKKRKKKKR